MAKIISKQSIRPFKPVNLLNKLGVDLPDTAQEISAQINPSTGGVILLFGGIKGERMDEVADLILARIPERKNSVFFSDDGGRLAVHMPASLYETLSGAKIEGGYDNPGPMF